MSFWLSQSLLLLTLYVSALCLLKSTLDPASEVEAVPAAPVAYWNPITFLPTVMASGIGPSNRELMHVCCSRGERQRMRL